MTTLTPPRWLPAWAAAFVLAAPAAAQEADGLTKLWDAARKGGRYLPPTAAELRRSEELFAATLRGDDFEQLKAGWAAARFELLAEGEGADRVLVVREHPDHRLGRGFYAFRTDAPAVALQAPHGWDDLHTGPAALQLFREGKVRAVAVNTVGRGDADFAHLPDTHFQAFTRALAAADRHGLVVQLHGFEAGKRKSDDGRQAGIIVSNGTRQPPSWMPHFADRLRADLTDGVKLYPRDVRELGGTTNAQARLLGELGCGFAHLEMDLALRRRLRYEPAARGALLKAVAAACDEARGVSR